MYLKLLSCVGTFVRNKEQILVSMKYQILQLTLSLLSVITSLSLAGQGWERIYFTDPNPDLEYTYSSADHVFLQDDGTYLFGTTVEGQPRWLYTDENGYITNLTPAVHTGEFLIQASDQNFVYAQRTSATSPPEQDVRLVKFDLAGNVLWTYYPEGYIGGNEAVSDLIQSTDDDYVFVGARALPEQGTAAPYITKVNEAGDVVWKTIGPSLPQIYLFDYKVIELADGSYFMVASPNWFSMDNPIRTQALRFAANGDVLWSIELSIDIQVNELVAAADGNPVMIGRKSNNDFSLLKLDADGNVVWESILPEEDYLFGYIGGAILTTDGGFAFIGNTQVLSEDLHLVKTDDEGQVQWRSFFGGAFGDNGQDLKECPEGGYLVGGGANRMGEDQSAYLVKTDAEGNASPGTISGLVQYDTNENCVVDADEQALENWIVTAQATTGLFYASVRADGTYEIPVSPEDYTVRLTVPNDYWLPCANDVAVTVTDDAVVDFPVQSIEQCPLMEVQVQNFGLRLCEQQTVYVHASNQGTTLAEEVSVDVMLDDSLQLISASVPFTDLGDNTYNFELGAIDFLQDTTFTLEVMTGCDISLMGQSLCIEAYIYPDTTCLPIDELWSGASIELSAACEGDEVQLIIENVGDADMMQQLRYTVIEDHVIMLEDEPFGPLMAGQSITIPREANGTFYRIESEQEPFHPGLSMPSAFIEACGTGEDGTVSLGFVNQYPFNDGDYHIDITCTEVLAAYDPNAKYAHPEGYESSHFIEANTKIDYQLHFQNTGTATANKVVLMDELSPHLDPTTIRPGVSSHDYEFELLLDGTIRFTFNDIQLPDSTSNEPGSHGFVQFSVAQKPDLPLGTVIENTAAIYFDFNPAILTNTTFHTIGRDFILVEVGEVLPASVSVQAFPNPFAERATFVVEGAEQRTLGFVLYDASGRKVLSDHFAGSSYELDGTRLPAGVYFYQILDGNELLNSGKLIAQ